MFGCGGSCTDAAAGDLVGERCCRLNHRVQRRYTPTYIHGMTLPTHGKFFVSPERTINTLVAVSYRRAFFVDSLGVT